MNENIVKTGDYVVIQRQNYTKLYKLKSNSVISLGKDQVELENAINKPYFSTFRMVPKPNCKRIYSLETSEYINSIQNVNIDKSGIDNRHLSGDGQSQQLTNEEIVKLRDDALSSSEIVNKLISNSKTFNSKTEYSQEKYLKKKEKKYFEFIQIRRPTIRLIADIYFKQDYNKILGIRLDDLSQILTYSNVQNDSKVLLYDSGTSGLVPAAILNRIGANTCGYLIYMFPGNICQKEALLAIHFPEEQLNRCIKVCLYSVLRCYYQKNFAVTDDQQVAEDEPNENNKRKLIDSEKYDKSLKKPCWQIDNERACQILENNKADSLIIIAKEHPGIIVSHLLEFLNDGKPFVIFSLIRELLETLYVELKSRADIISARLLSTMLRNYQVLPNRTHPEMSMSSGGYILTGFKICTN